MGYGSLHLAAIGKSVVGADIDMSAISYAQQHYRARDNLSFIQADAMRTGFAESQFDVICSFETIEHMRDPNAFLVEIKRVLTPGGVFIVSTPRVTRSDSRPDNPYHFQEWNALDFQRLISGYFKSVEIFGQFRMETSVSRWLKRLDVLKLRKWLLPLWVIRRAAHASGVRATPDLHLEDICIRSGDLGKASEIVAVASDEN